MEFLNACFLPMLLGWSAAWLLASTIGLWATSERRFWRGFWFMSAPWCVVNAAIVVWSLLDPAETVEAFRRLLLVNVGLGVGYQVCGITLLTRKRPELKGFGASICVQGGALLIFDVAWYFALGS